MSTLMHAESRRSYSWWWGSHIGPKNSKWLQENLTDMDAKVKAMIRLIEEDADSFARRAEMYYKKRPELLKFVEEFYRAYRALAERYDHATGALRHAHQTIAEVLPNQIPLVPDESPSISNDIEVAPYTPEMPSSVPSLFDSDYLQTDVICESTNFHARERNGACSEGPGSMAAKKGLKQLNEMFARDGTARVELHEGKLRKGFKFHEQEEEKKASVSKVHVGSQILFELQSKKKENDINEMKHLQDELSKLQFEKESASLQNQILLESISSLKIEISEVNAEFGRLNEEIMKGTIKISTAEEHCIMLAKEKVCLKQELEEMKKGLEEMQILSIEYQTLLGQEVKEKESVRNNMKRLEEAFSQLCVENENLRDKIYSECKHLDLSRSEVQQLRDATSKLEAEKTTVLLQNELYLERISSLETEIYRAEHEIKMLHEEIITGIVKLDSTEERRLHLEKEKEKLELELEERKRRLEEMQVLSMENCNLLAQEVKKKENAKNEIKNLQEEFSKVLIKNEGLNSQLLLELKQLDLCRAEVQNSGDEMCKLLVEKEAYFFQNQLFRENISSMELESFGAKDAIGKLHEEIVMAILKLSCVEEECLTSSEKTNQSLKLELEEWKKMLEELRILSTLNQNLLEQEVKVKENARNAINCLQEELYELNKQMVSAFQNVDTFKTEVQHLRSAMSQLGIEKETALFQYLLSQESICLLETEISVAKYEMRKLYEEILMGVVILCSTEEQNLELYEINQSLNSELKEIKLCLEELRISFIEMDNQCLDAERSLQSRDRLYNLSQKKAKLMTLEMQTIFEKLNDIKVIKVGLEEEVCQLKSVNNSLTGHNLAYALQLKHMQDDMIFLKEKNCKLEDELKVHLDDRKVFQQVLDFVKDDRDELDMKHKNLIEQMRESNLKIDYLETLVKELNCGLAELKQGCMKVEDEKLQLLFKLRDVEAISESNAVLRNSLSDANMELEALREKIRVLEDSYENLNIEISNNAIEKAVLATNIEVLADNVVKLSEKNTLLESSLADANSKLEGLQTRLGDLNNYNRSLSVENLNLLIQKEALISQVESIRNGQAHLKTRNALLENKLVTLEKEKELSFTQIIELKNDLKIKQRDHESLINSSKICLRNLENQIHLLREDKKFRDDDLEFVQQKCLSYMIEAYVLLTCLNDLKGYLIIEKQNHDHHIQSSKNHLATLENKIDLLQEERQLREYEVDEEQKKLMNYMLENFILWRCLSETKEKNFILLEECYKHLEVSRCAEEVISQLEDSKLLHVEKFTLLMEHNAKLKDGMNLLLESLNINSELMGMIGTEVVLQAILCEIAHLLSTVSDFQDENQLLHMELSVYRTLLKQSALEKFFIGQVLGRAGDQLLVLQWDQNWLLETCKQLEQEVNDRDYLNEALKFELLVLSRHLMDLSKELYALRKEKNAMEEENNVLLGEAMTLEHLQLYFRRSTTENMHVVKVLGEGFCSLLKIRKDLNDLKIETDMRLKIVDTENKMLKDSFFLLEELRSQVTVLEFDLFTTRVLCEELILEVETRETLLERKNMEILRSRHKLQCMEKEVTRLCAKLETMNKDLYEAQMVRSQLEEKVTDLFEAQACNAMEIATSYDEKRVLNDKLIRLNDEVELLRGREEHVSCKLQEKLDEIERCEGEFIKFIHEVQAFAINIAVLEDQLLQLVVAYVGVQICALAQREMLKEGVTLRNTFAFEFTKILDDLKVENGKLEAIWNACFPLFISLDDGIAAIEKQAQQLAELDEEQENSSVNHQDETKETSISGHPSMLGALQLQNLVSRVEAIQRLMIDTNSQLKQERLQYAAELDAARREIEGLKLENSYREEKQGNEASRGKQGQVMKDIELDQVSSSNVVSRIQSAESEDQMLKLWETAERECSNMASNSQEVLPSEEAGGGHLQHIDEKELGVDKQDVSNEIKEYQVEWKKEVFERLNSASKRLSDIQTSAEKLKSKISKCRRHISSEVDDMLPKLKETEEEISQLFNIERMLRRKVEEEYCEPSNNNEEARVLQRRQASEQARTIMEQIEKLEVELEKTHHVFLKIEQECANTTTQKVDRLPRILLRDLMHEKRSGRVRKRGLFCGCIKLPKTKE